MVQVLLVKGPAQAEVWVEVKAKAEAEAEAEAGWADRLQQVRAEIVSAQVAEQGLLMLWDSLVMQQAVLNVVQK